MPSSNSSPFSSFWPRDSSPRQSPRAYNRPYPEPPGGVIPSPSFLPEVPRPVAAPSPGIRDPLVFNNCNNCADEHKKLEDEHKKVRDLQCRNVRLFWEKQILKDQCSKQEQELEELNGYFIALSEGEREFMQHARSVTEQACRRANIDRKKVVRLREYVDYQIGYYSKAFTVISMQQEQLKAWSAAKIEEQREVNWADALRFRAVEASKNEQIHSLEAELAKAKQDCAFVTARHDYHHQCVMTLMVRLRELQPLTTNGPAHTTNSSKHDDVAEAEAKVRHLVGEHDGDAQQRAAAVTTLKHRITGLDAELQAAFAKLDELHKFELGPSSA
ncbi:hypothetical protein BB8028_0007g01370 [Beauveria bassiana]|uniref:Uncharacterized protein n=1 Tax=Beauveria bassiana TaxID=176275 RepID=A0A2S7YLH6_BEABA|nr:hypothetical protein BB8028_0007g01370 [Beauveria bassiana]